MVCANITANAHSRMDDMKRFLANGTAKVGYVYYLLNCLIIELQMQDK